ncbi:MAG: membrane protease YdiL (CAAX protease family) [Psychromonas sp.]|jgi:membrane protease YdiL (CAAX protease family)
MYFTTKLIKLLSKSKIYILGLVTLLVFPVPAWFYRIYYLKENSDSFFRWDEFQTGNVLFGLSLGIIYAIIALLALSSPVFEPLPNRVEDLIKKMNLNIFDAIFLSLCAGIGEELLFRNGIQHILGPIITTLIFIVIHGYFDPRSWRKSLYGVILLPFVLVLSYGYIYFGQWFSVAAHFSYDLVLFSSLIGAKKISEQ